MKEEIQIEQGARLTDHKAPEKISNERARAFISGRMAKESKSVQRHGVFKIYSTRPALVWSVSAFALAAAMTAVVFLGPSNGAAVSGSQVFENESVHASSEVMDTTAVSASDTLSTFELPTVE